MLAGHTPSFLGHKTPVTTHTSLTSTHVAMAVHAINRNSTWCFYAGGNGQIETCVAGHLAVQAENNLH